MCATDRSCEGVKLDIQQDLYKMQVICIICPS